jgi:hypothetical protein
MERRHASLFAAGLVILLTSVTIGMNGCGRVFGLLFPVQIIIWKNKHHVTKTGSGRTQRKLTKRTPSIYAGGLNQVIVQSQLQRDGGKYLAAPAAPPHAANSAATGNGNGQAYRAAAGGKAPKLNPIVFTCVLSPFPSLPFPHPCAYAVLCLLTACVGGILLCMQLGDRPLGFADCARLYAKLRSAADASLTVLGLRRYFPACSRRSMRLRHAGMH